MRGQIAETFLPEAAAYELPESPDMIVTGEVMAETFGEWRRAGSPCAGALVLWLKDLLPGAGWGVLDDRGDPKPAFHHLRRALAPVALWTVDEGLGGFVAHVANDGPSTLAADLHLALYRGGEQSVGEAQTAIDLSAHSQGEWDVEGILGRFADVGWAYRFGPPAQDAIVLRLLTRGHPASLIAHAVRFPVGRPLALETPGDLGLEEHVYIRNLFHSVAKVVAHRFVELVAADDQPNPLCGLR